MGSRDGGELGGGLYRGLLVLVAACLPGYGF